MINGQQQDQPLDSLEDAEAAPGTVSQRTLHIDREHKMSGAESSARCGGLGKSTDFTTLGAQKRAKQ
jgi:hypothetical protein